MNQAIVYNCNYIVNSINNTLFLLFTDYLTEFIFCIWTRTAPWTTTTSTKIAVNCL